jgi:hypothetical protein
MQTSVPKINARSQRPGINPPFVLKSLIIGVVKPAKGEKRILLAEYPFDTTST